MSATKKRRPASVSAGIPDQLRQIIAARGMTAYSVAQAADVSPSVVSRFLSRERGLTLETFDAIAGALGLRIIDGGRGRGRPSKPRPVDTRQAADEPQLLRHEELLEETVAPDLRKPEIAPSPAHGHAGTPAHEHAPACPPAPAHTHASAPAAPAYAHTHAGTPEPEPARVPSFLDRLRSGATAPVDPIELP